MNSFMRLSKAIPMYRTVTIYTDGSCRPNPGIGGWAAAIRRTLLPEEVLFVDRKDFTGEPEEYEERILEGNVLENFQLNYCFAAVGVKLETTSQEMELTAAVRALELVDLSNEFMFRNGHDGIQTVKAVIVSDSEYVTENASNYLEEWEHGNWKMPRKHKELWQQLFAATKRFTYVNWEHVDAHSGVEHNELCHELANDAVDELERKAGSRTGFSSGIPVRRRNRNFGHLFASGRRFST